MAVVFNFKKNSKSFKLVLNCVNSLYLNNEATWIDEHGITIINIGRNLVSNLLKEWDENAQSYMVIFSPIVKNQLKSLQNYKFKNNFLKENIDNILSIGGAWEHNLSKEFILRSKKEKPIQFVTVPVPLSNDSFGTNRYSPYFGKVDIPSIKSVYPSKIIIDLKLLHEVDDGLNIMGIGEVIGLYYSIRDYYSVRRLSHPKDLIDNIETNLSNLITSLQRDKDIWLKHLAINLIEKCLIMRVAGDHQIGAGGDHLLAYAIEYYINYNKNINERIYHGKLVYMGSVIMAALFPEWKYGIFSLENLVDIGINIGIINQTDLRLIEDLMEHKTIFSLALKMRPNRKTSLSTLTPNRIEKAHQKIDKCLKRREKNGK